MKQVGNPANGGYREHYIRDAQGNIMAVYRYLLEPVPDTSPQEYAASTRVVERPIYGSSRVGSYVPAQEVMGPWVSEYPFLQPLSNAGKRYELTDHLGNVNTVVSGRLLPVPVLGEQYQAEVITAQGYEPFGALLPGRNWRQPLGPPPPPVTPPGTLVITEFSNGPSGSCEYVELYVTKCVLYPEATEVDIRGWIVDDNAGNFNTSGGCTTGVGISPGHLRFADVPAWASVPVGTVIVLYNGGDNCYGFTVDESGTSAYFIDVENTALIERTGSGGTPSSSDCDYCDNTYTTATWDPVSLGNTADAIQVRCPDCPQSEAGFFHGVAYGSGFGGLVAGTNDLGGAYHSGPGGGRTYELTGTGAPGDGANWTRTTAPAAGTPPVTVGVVDGSVTAALESASLACCGSFEPPVLAEKHGYRWGFNGQEKDNEVYGSEGTSYTAEFWQYDPRVARRWNLDPVDKPWMSPYHAFSNKPITNIDPNGANDDYYQNAQGDIKWFDNTADEIVDKDMTSWSNIGTAYAEFNGTSLTLNYQTSTDGNLAPAAYSTPAVSGRPTKNGTFDYFQARQAMQDVGPIPEGSYSMDPSQIRPLTLKDEIIGTGAAWTQLLGRKTGAFPGGNRAWGLARIPIEPSSVQVLDPLSGNYVLRSGFTAHGGTSPGSAGCIDLMRGEVTFFLKLKQATSTSIKLIVDYSGILAPVPSPFNADGTGFSNEPPLTR